MKNGKVDGHIECNSVERSSAEENNGSKYLVFDSTDENQPSIKKGNITLGCN